MTGVRVLVGTRKGAFTLTSDGTRKKWTVSGPHFGGWEVYHMAGSPADPDRLYAAPSGGWFGECSDEEILHVQKLLAQAEGIFCEPASATGLAGVLKDLELGRIGEGSTIVCTLTGHGLKDPDTAIAQSAKPLTVDAELKAIERVKFVMKDGTVYVGNQ